MIPKRLATSERLQPGGHKRVASSGWFQPIGYKRVFTNEWLRADGYKFMATPTWVSVRELRELRELRNLREPRERQGSHLNDTVCYLRQHKHRCEQVDPMVHELEETLL